MTSAWSNEDSLFSRSLAGLFVDTGPRVYSCYLWVSLAVDGGIHWIAFLVNGVRDLFLRLDRYIGGLAEHFERRNAL